MDNLGELLHANLVWEIQRDFNQQRILRSLNDGIFLLNFREVWDFEMKEEIKNLEVEN